MCLVYGCQHPGFFMGEDWIYMSVALSLKSGHARILFYAQRSN